MSQKRAAATKTEKRSRNSDQLQPCMMSFRRQSRYPGRKLEQSSNYGFEIQHRAFVSPADVCAVPSERTRTSFHRPPPVWIVGRWENRTGSEDQLSFHLKFIIDWTSRVGVCAETQLNAFPQNAFFGRGTSLAMHIWWADINCALEDIVIVSRIDLVRQVGHSRFVNKFSNSSRVKFVVFLTISNWRRNQRRWERRYNKFCVGAIDLYLYLIWICVLSRCHRFISERRR